MNTPLRLLIVDDDLKVRRALKMRLQLDPGIDVVGEAADGPTALRLSASLSPDVVLLDLNLPGMSGLKTCGELRSRGFPVVLFSLEDGEATERRSLGAGAASFVSKHASANHLIAHLRAARVSVDGFSRR